MKVDLHITHINRLFELTELHMDWFELYYPDSKPTFSDLLSLNHKRLLQFCVIEKLGNFTDKDLEDKFEKMFKAYNSLFEITRLNRELDNKIYINSILSK
jgi:hypothetical protein